MNMKKIIAFILCVAMCAALLTACSSDKGGDAPKAPQSSHTGSDSSSDGQASAVPQNENTKYGDAEVYTNDEGKDVAKTENGVEVELSNDNLARLYTEYQKVAGTGSDEEKQLLDQIQLILEASQNVQQVTQ